LQGAEVGSVFAGFEDSRITLGRIRKLLERSAALGLVMEKWQRAGLWVMTRSDADYPRRLKQRLKNDAPPVLFGAGNRDLLNRGGIGVVGSRDLDELQLAFTGGLGRDIACQGQAVISGGAQGADEAAMLGALESEGMAVGVLADSLLRASTSARYRKALMRNDLALVSPFNPEAGFNVGNAMARNKYIYCLSDATIVIAATENKGGTWAGAIENLKQGWVPLWVRQDDVDGNRALVQKGAHWLSGRLDVQQLLANGGEAVSVAEGLRAYPAKPSMPDTEPSESTGAMPDTDAACEAGPKAQSVLAATSDSTAPQSPYQIFLLRLRALLQQQALSLQELGKVAGIERKPLSEWLKLAEADGLIVKTRSPVKYRLKSGDLVPHEGKSGTKSKKDTRLDERKSPQSGFGF
jgi:predicted Rossmann fold nucleotide-binding protein DprA/Smf involved in DNA uptake